MGPEPRTAASAPALDIQLVVRSIQRQLARFEEAKIPIAAIAMDPTVWAVFRDIAGERWNTAQPTLFNQPVVRDVTVQGWSVRVAR